MTDAPTATLNTSKRPRIFPFLTFPSQEPPKRPRLACGAPVQLKREIVRNPWTNGAVAEQAPDRVKFKIPEALVVTPKKPVN